MRQTHTCEVGEEQPDVSVLPVPEAVAATLQLQLAGQQMFAFD